MSDETRDVRRESFSSGLVELALTNRSRDREPRGEK
jgi:hypothetical protein